MTAAQAPVVGVTGMIASDSPAPGVAVARSLRAEPRFQGRVIGLAYDVMEAGNFLKGVVDEVYLLPYPSQGHEDFFQRLLEIKRRSGLDVLIPTLDAELPLVIKMADELQAKGIATFLPTLEQFNLRSKDRLFAVAARHGLPVPRSETAFDEPGVLKAAQELGYPVLVKGIFYEAYVAHTADEALHHLHKVSAKWGLPVIVQAYIQGDEYDVVAVGDGRGGLIGAVPMRKTVLSDKGKAWAGTTVADDRLLDLTRRTMQALEWRGPLELEVMKDRSDRHYILEINPRFPAWVYLAQAAAQNLPYACLELAQRRKVKPLAPHRAGVAFIRAAMDHIIPVGDIEGLVVRGHNLNQAEPQPSSERQEEVAHESRIP